MRVESDYHPLWQMEDSHHLESHPGQLLTTRTPFPSLLGVREEAEDEAEWGEA